MHWQCPGTGSKTPPGKAQLVPSLQRAGLRTETWRGFSAALLNVLSLPDKLPAHGKSSVLSASLPFLLVLLHYGTAGLYNCMRTSCSPGSLCVTLLGLHIFYYVWLLVRVRRKLFPDYNKATSNIISVVRSLTVLK